jgi:hypothetical protein
MKSLNGNYIAAVILGTFLVTGCGNGSTKSYTTAPNGFIPSSTSAALSASNQKAIFGNYGGTLESTYLGGGEVDSQGYTLTLGQATVSGNSNTYVNMILASSGSAFDNINDQELLDFNPAGQGTFAGDQRFVFYTTPHIIAGLSNTAVQLEIDIYLTAAGQVDSSQSQIIIYDCGFANTCNTTSTYQDALFVGLVKH